MTEPYPVETTPDVEAAAEALRFAETAGGPLILLHRRDAPSWWGAFDEEGEPAEDEDGTSHHEQTWVSDVCVLEVGAVRALVLPEPHPVAVYPVAGGDVLLVCWAGADSAAGVLAASLAIPEAAWRRIDDVLELDGGPLLLIDSARDGRALEEDGEETLEVVLPAGRYAIDWAYGLEAVVLRGGAREETGVQAVRLRPLAG